MILSLINDNEYDAIVIGGGFYGLCVALYLKEGLGRSNILILEREAALMSRASYVNQARVHNGYHYPRSILTAARSAANFSRFVNDFEPAVVSDFDKYYAIAKNLSKVNAKQFQSFCEKIGIPANDPSNEIADLFEPHMVERTFKVREYAFDSRKLRSELLRRVGQYADITIRIKEKVERVESSDRHSGSLTVHSASDRYYAAKVFNCTYAQINSLHRASGLELMKFKHQVTEMCLVELPETLKNFSVTVMDGPFFSIMPFPSRGLYTLSHVRYTPHTSWTDDSETPVDRHDTYDFLRSLDSQSAFEQMKADVVRYMPIMKDMRMVDNLREVKTVLVKSGHDDSRPILFRSDFGIEGYSCIMGGKLDNVYDIYQELDRLYEA